MSLKTLIWAAGVFAAVFLCVLAGPYALKSLGSGSAPVKTDAEHALDAGTLDREDAKTIYRLKKLNVHLTLADLNRFKTDAPDNGAYAAYTEIGSMAWEAVNPRAADIKPHKAICYSLNDKPEASHMVIYYNADHFYGVSVDLVSWIRSGCAAALQAHHNTSSRLVFFETVKSKIPNTPDYKYQRESWAGNMYMACTDDSRTRNTRLSSEASAIRDMKSSVDCRKRSGV